MMDTIYTDYQTSTDQKGKSKGEANAADLACVVCYTAPKDTVCLPCIHLCICKSCSEIIKHMDADSNMRNRCPMCRHMSTHFIQINSDDSTDKSKI